MLSAFQEIILRKNIHWKITKWILMKAILNQINYSWEIFHKRGGGGDSTEKKWFLHIKKFHPNFELLRLKPLNKCGI